MRHTEAEALVVALRAAFARPPWDEATKALYISKLSALEDGEAAWRAVNLLIEGSVFRPTIAEILNEYRPLARRNSEAHAETHGLPLPELTEDERRANLARVRELQKRIEEAVEL